MSTCYSSWEATVADVMSVRTEDGRFISIVHQFLPGTFPKAGRHSSDHRQPTLMPPVITWRRVGQEESKPKGWQKLDQLPDVGKTEMASAAQVTEEAVSCTVQETLILPTTVTAAAGVL